MADTPAVPSGPQAPSPEGASSAEATSASPAKASPANSNTPGKRSGKKGGNGPPSRIFASRAMSLGGKLITIFIVTLVMGFALDRVRDLILERQALHNQVRHEIGALWGGEQQLSGPFLAVPYGTPGERPGSEFASVVGTAYFLPERLSLDTTVASDVRSRGLFDAVVYTTTLSVTGGFQPPSRNMLVDALNDAPDDVVLLWDRASLVVGLSDMKGVESIEPLKFAGVTYSFQPRSTIRLLGTSGLEAPTPLVGITLPPSANSRGSDADEEGDSTTLPEPAPIPFSVSITLKGSERLSFLPVGRATVASMKSDWPSPSFDGAYLPAEHEITSDGFAARWQVSEFGRGYGRLLFNRGGRAQQGALARSSFGVRLMQPVTPYRKAERAIKYGLLFVVFTFAFVFVVEIVTKRPVHFIQYATLGIPLCLFFLLLVAFAEHMGFATAYGAGAGAVLLLVAYYVWQLLARWHHVALICGLLAGLFGFLYTLLELESYSLLWGAIGLWVLTGVFMYVTSRIDWSGKQAEEPYLDVDI